MFIKRFIHAVLLVLLSSSIFNVYAMEEQSKEEQLKKDAEGIVVFMRNFILDSEYTSSDQKDRWRSFMYTSAEDSIIRRLNIAHCTDIVNIIRNNDLCASFYRSFDENTNKDSKDLTISKTVNYLCKHLNPSPDYSAEDTRQILVDYLSLYCEKYGQKISDNQLIKNENDNLKITITDKDNKYFYTVLFMGLLLCCSCGYIAKLHYF